MTTLTEHTTLTESAVDLGEASAVIVSSGVNISCVRVSNFRSIKDVEVSLDNLTLLIGANNVGKTSFLDALQAAIGATRRPLGKEDIHLDEGETDAPKDRKAVIDILILPTDDQGVIAEKFPLGSFWTNLWGDGISQSEPDLNDQVVIRTTLEWSYVHGDYRTARHFLKEWKPRSDWLTAEEGASVTASHIEPIALHYIDAKRDLDDDLRNRTSFWRRLTDDLDLTEADVTALEAALTSLNQAILEKSAVLKHLRETLLGLQHVVVSQAAGVDIAPVPRRLRDLSRGVDVTLSTTGTQAFPITRHGMGTRSLASLLVFRAFASWRQKRATDAGDLVHTILALEEPEAHLHPQAQRALFGQIKLIPGQRIVSTHSPYFAAQSTLENMRVVTKASGNTQITRLNLSGLTPDQRRKLDREVIFSRGDLLFARALILFEGETEEQALPIFADAKWGASVHELGFSFVGVSGGNYYPFVYLAQKFQIPWYIFSDGEPKPVANLKSTLGRLGIAEAQIGPNVQIIPSGLDYEALLLHEGYADAIELAIKKAHGDEALNDYIATLNGKKRKAVDGVQTQRNYTGPNGRSEAMLDYMRENKTRVAAPIATEIVGLPDEQRRIPTFLGTFFDVLGKDFKIGQ